MGVLRTAVAVKRLEREDKESPKAFCRELMIASSLHHPNVAPLIGFCMDAEEGFFLVYKYVSGGSLELHLHGGMPFSFLLFAGSSNLKFIQFLCAFFFWSYSKMPFCRQDEGT